jgi:hypothetical protein
MHGKSLSAKIGILALDITADSDIDKSVAKNLETDMFDEKPIKWNDRNNLLKSYDLWSKKLIMMRKKY